MDERFEIHPNGLITDKQHNLCWLPKDSYQDLGKWLNWNELTSYVRIINSVYPGGHSDFRLPTAEELKLLFNFDYTNTDWKGETIYINSLFTRKCSHYLWAQDVDEEGKAFRIDLRTGASEYVDKEQREHHAARLVRLTRHP